MAELRNLMLQSLPEICGHCQMIFWQLNHRGGISVSLTYFSPGTWLTYSAWRPVDPFILMSSNSTKAYPSVDCPAANNPGTRESEEVAEAYSPSNSVRRIIESGNSVWDFSCKTCSAFSLFSLFYSSQSFAPITHWFSHLDMY